jgi:hypothetical protein
MATNNLTSDSTYAFRINRSKSPGDFAQTNNCPTTLASGVSCAITVTFTPTDDWQANRKDRDQ